MKFLTGRIEALEEHVQSERAKLGAGGNNDAARKSGPLTGLLEGYQVLLMDQEFSEKAYISALSALEVARLEASRRHRYLATFVKPSLPEEALYPTRLLNIFFTFVVSGIFWAVGTLVVYAIRDHVT